MFFQTFVDGANGTVNDGYDTLSGFPCFHAGGTPKPLGFLSYNGPMIGAYSAYGKWGTSPVSGGVGGSGPTVLFSADLTVSMVLSSANNFMAASQVCGRSSAIAACGLISLRVALCRCTTFLTTSCRTA